MTSIHALSLLSIFGAVVCGAGCGGENAAADGSASDDALTSQDEMLTRHARRHAFNSATPAPAATPSPTPTPSATVTAAPAPAPAPAPSPAATPSDIASLIAAAQTPDGLAIPQPAGPGGQCAPVVAALGFWACPTVGETCSFAANGTGHQCACMRTQGEGQTPSWICN